MQIQGWGTIILATLAYFLCLRERHGQTSNVATINWLIKKKNNLNKQAINTISL